MKKLILSLVFISTISIQAGHHEMAKDAKFVVKKAYATFASGDTEAWTALHAKDLTFTVFGDIPTTGKHIGPDAVIKNVFEPIAKHWPNFNLEHKAMYSDGNMVFVHSHMTADGLDTETLHMFKVENGIIQSFTAFDDTGSMAAAVVK
ncbi:nuclear transport factor 2 family protein [Gammaproteobacteria bacterium]|nr:nuclear transport factor 2 family protein [Gammaproteobacteria bacterium]